MYLWHLIYILQVRHMLDELDNEWVTFQQCLLDSDVMLKKNKEKFKTGLIHSSEEFKKSIANLLDDFSSNGKDINMFSYQGTSLFQALKIYYPVKNRFKCWIAIFLGLRIKIKSQINKMLGHSFNPQL